MPHPQGWQFKTNPMSNSVQAYTRELGMSVSRGGGGGGEGRGEQRALQR